MIRSLLDEPTRRPRVIALLGAIALLAALGHVLLPVAQDQFVYEFSPASAGSEIDLPNPAVAGLALARAEPDEFDVTLPCEVSDPTSGFNTLSLGLWRSAEVEQRSAILYPDLGRALSVTVGDDVVSVLVRSREIFREPVATGPGCEITLRYDAGGWTLGGDTTHRTVHDPDFRFAEASFAGPAATSPISSVRVVTRELGSTPTPLQLAMWLIGASAVAGAVWLALRGSSRRSGRRFSFEGPDIMVFVGLLAWLVIIPLNIDDGWIAARFGSYPVHGDIAGLFTSRSAPMPFGYWLEWLQHLWLALGESSLMLRIPGVLVGAFTWAALRSVGRDLSLWGRARWVSWVAGAVFLVGYGAWGVTLRAEPILAALVLASAVGAVRFQREPATRTLVWWAAAVVLAITLHPAGIIAVAPVLVSMPALWRWSRGAPGGVYFATGIALCAVAAGLLLFFVDANAATRSDSIDAYRSAAHSLTVLDEPDRYGFLDATPYATPMRRASVAFVFVAIGTFVLNLASRAKPVTRVPGWALLLGVVLLSVTPSKWPWHFGGLMAVAVLVVVLELPPARPTTRWTVMVATASLMAWAWSEALDWAVFDLRRYEWASGAENLLPVDLGSLIVWAGLVALVGTIAWWLGGQSFARSRPAALMIGASAALVVAITAATLVADTIATDGWTFGGQNLSAAIGRANCGLGDEIEIPRPGSLRLLSRVDATSVTADEAAGASGFAESGVVEPVGYPRTGINRTLPVAGMETFGTHVAVDGASPDANVAAHRSDWVAMTPDTDRVAVMVLGLYEHWNSVNAMAVQWGRLDGDSVVAVGIDEATELSGVFADWRMHLFVPPDDADVVRTLLRDGTTGRGEAWVAAGEPLGLSMGTVETVAATDGVDILASPAISPYFPCVDVPRFADGVIVQPPGVLLQTWRTFWQTTFAAAGSTDRYFLVPVEGDPPLKSGKVGAHSGDVEHFVFVSQEHLTGSSARVTGAFTRVGG